MKLKPSREYIKARDVINSLPEIGPITAERLVQYLIINDDKRESLITALELLRNLKPCINCGIITDEDECDVCKDEFREPVVLVVKTPFEVHRVEDSGRYNGRYFVVYNLLSPAEGLSMDRIPKEKFLKFVEKFSIKEVIIGLPNDVRGEVTAYFLVEGLKGVKITKLASGVPRGEEISSLDPYTLYEAIENRVPFEL